MAPERPATCQDILRDSSAIGQLWPCLESIPRQVDAPPAFVRKLLEGRRPSAASSGAAPP